MSDSRVRDRCRAEKDREPPKTPGTTKGIPARVLRALRGSRLSCREPKMALSRFRNLHQDVRMKSLVLGIILCLCLAAAARTPRHASRPASDPAYSSALAAANRFLHAWQNEDHEAGIVMLADSARQDLSPATLQAFFSPGPNAAYEIAHGQRLHPGEYSFPLVLFGSSQGLHRRSCKLIVVRSGKDDWAVEKLP